MHFVFFPLLLNQDQKNRPQGELELAPCLVSSTHLNEPFTTRSSFFYSFPPFSRMWLHLPPPSPPWSLNRLWVMKEFHCLKGISKSQKLFSFRFALGLIFYETSLVLPFMFIATFSPLSSLAQFLFSFLRRTCPTIKPFHLFSQLMLLNLA